MCADILFHSACKALHRSCKLLTAYFDLSLLLYIIGYFWLLVIFGYWLFLVIGYFWLLVIFFIFFFYFDPCCTLMHCKF